MKQHNLEVDSTTACEAHAISENGLSNMQLRENFDVLAVCLHDCQCLKLVHNYIATE